MENYSLQSNEVVLFKADVYNGIRVVLTNLNLVLIKRIQRLFKKDEFEVSIFQKENIKIYNEITQIKQKEASVEVFLISKEIKIDFYSRNEAHKFVNSVYELLTNKTITTRGADKVKRAIHLVDDTLGINTVDTVKNVMENGIIGSIFGGINKKSKSKENSTVNETVEIAKDIIGATATNAASHNKEENNNFDKKIENIKKLKELLDAEIITQEEFDSKKKEILGL